MAKVTGGEARTLGLSPSEGESQRGVGTEGTCPLEGETSASLYERPEGHVPLRLPVMPFRWRGCLCLIVFLAFSIVQLSHGELGRLCIKKRPYHTDGQPCSSFIYFSLGSKENFKLLTIMLVI